MPSAQNAVEQLVADEALSIRWLPGREDRLVLAFSGVQQELGLPPNEFMGTASAGGRNHVLFVGEPRPSWYSAAGVHARIVDEVGAFVARHGIGDIRTIGNSMGGYGALLFSGEFPVRTVCSFSPQVSMDPAVIAERRWGHFRGNFGPDLARSAGDAMLRSEAEFFVTFGANDGRDAEHARLLPKVPRLHLFVLAGAAHDAVRILKERGILAEVVGRMLEGDLPAVRRLYRGFERGTTGAAERLVSKVRWRVPRSVRRIVTPGAGRRP